ncbi:MAG: ribose 5-phosphate isomerase B [Bacteroidales bacterium]|nr:ribose 5-phosphate isomerase B [Bacteroidales bacterium]
MTTTKIGFASDHAGFQMKQSLKISLEKKGYQTVDFGCFSTESVDYPDFAHPLAYAVENGECLFGVAVCATGNGINMTVNKHAGIRSALCWTEEIARLSRAHNDANICSLPARFMELEEAQKILDIFLHTGFDGGRHARRVEKISLSPDTKL